jgi:hypothetical protein
LGMVGIVNGVGDGVVPPQAPALAQVMTLPGTDGGAYSQGDYIGVQQIGPPDSRTEIIVRNVNIRDWFDLSPGFSFPANTVQALAVSGGHRDPVVYVVKTDGTIIRGQVNTSGRVPAASWRNVSDGIRRAVDIFADPYHQDVLYVTDSDAQEILSSHVAPDGQVSWTPEPELKRIATHNGEYEFRCYDKSCPLQQVLFSHRAPEMRVAILFPGGVAFSRDSGQHWIPITDQLWGMGQLSGVRQFSDLIAHPYSGFFDIEADSHGGNASLYLALRGRGLVRLDGPFATLEQLEFEFDPQRRMAHAGRPEEKVVAINESTGVITQLHLQADGMYRGSEILDAAGYSTIRYRIVADSGTRAFSHTLTPAERDAGIASFGSTAETPAEQTLSIDPISATPTALGYEAGKKDVNKLPKSAAEFQVTGISLKVEIEKLNGPCPAVLKFVGSVTVNAPGTVKYRFLRSDVAVGPVEILHFDAAGTKTVSTMWTLGGPDLMTYDGWQAIRVLSPNVLESDKALFSLRCEKSEKQ